MHYNSILTLPTLRVQCVLKIIVIVRLKGTYFDGVACMCTVHSTQYTLIKLLLYYLCLYTLLVCDKIYVCIDTFFLSSKYLKIKYRPIEGAP